MEIMNDTKMIEPLPGECALRFHTICEINNAIVTRHDPESLFAAIAEEIRNNLPFDRASLTLYEESAGGFVVHALSQPVDESPIGIGAVIPYEVQGAIRTVYDARECRYVEEVTEDTPYPDELEMLKAGFRSVAQFPLMVRETCLGVFSVANRLPMALTDRNLAFLEEVAKQISLAVANMRAFEEIRSLQRRLERENSYLKAELDNTFNVADVVGKSPEIREVMDHARSVASTNATVIVYGETGSGKELIARAVHNNSTRKDRPLIKVNCAALSSGVIESELFGHEKGAFTGAVAQRQGRFELADGGTLFLDEVGDVAPEVQPKLLRVLQEQEFERVGGTKTIRVDVRVIAATHRDLKTMVEDGSFREDLFYRLNVFPIVVPPLRERPDDIGPLVHYFVQKYASRHGIRIEEIEDATLARLRKYPWPGNVRELEHVVERALILSRDGVFTVSEAMLPRKVPKPAPSMGLKSLDDMERAHIRKVLEKTGWAIAGDGGAAEILEMHPNTLRSRMKKLGIEKP